MQCGPGFEPSTAVCVVFSAAMAVLPLVFCGQATAFACGCDCIFSAGIDYAVHDAAHIGLHIGVGTGFNCRRYRYSQSNYSTGLRELAPGWSWVVAGTTAGKECLVVTVNTVVWSSRGWARWRNGN